MSKDKAVGADQQKQKLALACRVLSANGHEDLILGHISVRADDQDQVMYMKGHEVCLSEVQVDDILAIDFNGKVLSGTRPRHSEWPIHAEIYKYRSDVNCVVHTHPFYATTLSASSNKILPVSHDGVMFAGKLPFFTETSEMVSTPAFGVSLAKALGNARAILMENHGITTVGGSVEEAAVVAFHLERAAKYQLFATLHGNPTWPDEDEVARKEEFIFAWKKMKRTWDALVRKLEREESLLRILPALESYIRKDRQADQT